MKPHLGFIRHVGHSLNSSSCAHKFLKQLADDLPSRLLGDDFWKGERQCLFAAVLDALRLVKVGAEITYLDLFRFWVEKNSAELAGFYAPSAAVAQVLIYQDDALLGVLRQRVARARKHARRVGAIPAVDGQHDDGLNTRDSNAR